MTLEKNKIYKCVHFTYHMAECFHRDYIIFSPSKDKNFDETKMTRMPSVFLEALCSVECIFLIDFCGVPYNCGTTTVFTDCHFEPLTNEDLKDVRYALNGKFRYNRKLNTLIPIENDTEGKTFI